MKASRLRVLALASLLGVVGALQTACTGPTFIVQQYDGAPRAPESVSIIRMLGSDSVRVVALDGEDTNAPIEEDVRLHIEVLPGKHTVVVANLAAPELPAQRISFQADPGRVYRAAFAKPAPGTPSPYPAVARMYEVGRDDDRYLRDVTLPAPSDSR